MSYLRSHLTLATAIRLDKGVVTLTARGAAMSAACYDAVGLLCTPSAEKRQEICVRRSALTALSRASKALRKIVTRYLYHFIYHEREDRGATLPSLIRTVTLR